MAEKKSLSGYWRTTFLIGLGFFTMGLMDPLYDNYIPMFLGNYIESSSLVGTVMTLDNILAIFLIPIFSALSHDIPSQYLQTGGPWSSCCPDAGYGPRGFKK